MSLTDIAKHVEKYAIDNSPSILTGIAAVGTVATAYLTGTATVKATRILNREMPADVDRFQDKVKLVWMEYIPPVIAGAFTITCIIGANKIGSRRAAAVAAAYSLSEKAFVEYKEKVLEKIGDKKEQKVRDEIAQDRVDKDPVTTREVIITGNGDVMCYDSLTGRYFLSNMESIRKAENEINKQILDFGYASLSEFYDKIGLSPTAFSEEVGWKYEGMLEVQFSTVISDDGKPCISIQYMTAPVRNYFRQH